jgi:hypothetical protein
VIVLTWLALSAEDEDISVRRRPSLVTSVYAVLGLLSVPITVAVAGLVQPAFAARISTMTEVAILLFASAVGAIALTFSPLPALNLDAELEMIEGSEAEQKPAEVGQ